MLRFLGRRLSRQYGGSDAFVVRHRQRSDPENLWVQSESSRKLLLAYSVRDISQINAQKAVTVFARYLLFLYIVLQFVHNSIHTTTLILIS